MADIQDYQNPMGRKREFEGPGGPGGPPGDFKKPRFDFQGGNEGEEQPPPATLRVLIRNSDAGGIIGKGGDNIKRLRKQYDCQVVLPDSAGAPERVMTIMGAIPNCVRVLEDVLNGLASDFRSSQPGDGDKEVQILIPQPFMGTIIGTGGTKIKDLRMRTKCNVKIFSDPMPGSNERSVQLVGSNEQIKECVEHFLEDIGKKEPREPIYLYEPAVQVNGPPDMGFQPPFRGGRGGGPMGRGGPPFMGRGGRGGGHGGGDMGAGGWRGGRGGRGGGPPGGNMRGGRGGGGGGRFNGSNNDGFQFGNNRAPPTQFTGQTQTPTPSGGNVGYGSTSQPSVGYSAQQAPPVQGVPSAPNMAMGMGPPPTGQYPPTQAPQPVQYPHQGAPPSQGYPAPQSQMQAPAPGGTAGSQSQQVTIPAEYTDAILGPNGSNLQHIKSQSSCEITLEPPKPGANERVITIMGSSGGIQYAQQLMQNSVRQHHPNV